jgi:hypothetical protein
MSLKPDTARRSQGATPIYRPDKLWADMAQDPQLLARCTLGAYALLSEAKLEPSARFLDQALVEDPESKWSVLMRQRRANDKAAYQRITEAALQHAREDPALAWSTGSRITLGRVVRSTISKEKYDLFLGNGIFYCRRPDFPDRSEDDDAIAWHPASYRVYKPGEANPLLGRYHQPRHDIKNPELEQTQYREVCEGLSKLVATYSLDISAIMAAGAPDGPPAK